MGREGYAKGLSGNKSYKDAQEFWPAPRQIPAIIAGYLSWKLTRVMAKITSKL
ncbi:MAG: hypothetical protein ACI9UA_002174 [Pseudoalteromonas tetraodonis]|jgi:hypothetical protein